MLMSVEELHDKDWPSSNSWCESYGEGWRMPTIDELTIIARKFTQINAILKANNYTLLTTANKCYWSSTVNPSNSDYYYREKLCDGTVFKNTGNDEKVSSKANYTRAIKMLSVSNPGGDIPVSSITLNKNSLVLNVGQSKTLSATVLPTYASNRTVVWSCSDETIATVDNNGVVTAIAEGNAVITAAAGGKSATCSVTVDNNSISGGHEGAGEENWD
jgi:transglutaminase/protease-like cytokinesis protein 3